MSWEKHGDAVKMDGQLNVQELQRDLARKHRNVCRKVDMIWRRFTPKQREKAMRESTGDGMVLKHSRDRALGDLCKYIPEYNLRDMTSKPEHFLDMFNFRAHTRLDQQLYEGTNGGPGDREVMEKTGLRYAQASDNEITCFLEGEHYGKSFTSTRATSELFPGIPPVIVQAIVLPRALGELVYLRQGYLFQFLNSIVEEILDLGSETRDKKALDKRENKALVTATSNLSIQPKALKSSLPEVHAQAMEQKDALQDYLFLLRTEAVVLNQAVNTAYWSRAELVPDDRGRILPAITDRYLSTAFFDTLTTAVKTIAIWDYITHLLQLLDGAIDKARRGLILQELSNTCHLEYRRAQESLKRNIARHFGVKRFKRVTDTASAQSKIVMKGQPSDYTVSDPQLHYILRLCHPDTSPVDAVQWVQKTVEYNARHFEDAKKISEAEMAALDDLAIIVSFIHMSSTAVSMIPMSRKSGLLFTARSTELEAELNSLKVKADLSDYLVPIDNLLEPRMATDALGALDNLIVQETGVRLGALYEDIVQESLADLEKMYTEAKARQETADQKTTYVPLPAEPLPDRVSRQAQRRARERKHPTNSSVYTIIPPLAAPPQPSIAESVQQFQVKTATASVFTTLFSRLEAHGSVSWTNFESAMTDLGFSVTPKGGSIYTFIPPTSMNSRPITLHRPHVSGIEGYRLLILARRLQRVYGWTAESFSVA